jgi:hypothetical protein
VSKAFYRLGVPTPVGSPWAEAAASVETVGLTDAVVPEEETPEAALAIGAESAEAGAAATLPEVSPASRTTLMSTDAAVRPRRTARTDLILSYSSGAILCAAAHVKG